MIPPTTTGNTQPNGRKVNNNGSSQLKRWSRARVVRSGRKLKEHHNNTETEDVVDHQTTTDIIHNDDISSSGCYCSSEDGGNRSRGGGGGEMEEVRGGKEIYMVSDGSGWTAEHSVNAALGQFEHLWLIVVVLSILACSLGRMKGKDLEGYVKELDSYQLNAWSNSIPIPSRANATLVL
ncbi:hypothetical protein OSB04_002566 [Centaurea solstitialis]|uniref:Uncharacterized protein n=1 Tax=Centaurea solstitialis TaxID=347529 RepID=A0AA38WTA2_9ASTR|nr:hypothetical protein OSB04_002566 [Centaurea solstitialis]